MQQLASAANKHSKALSPAREIGRWRVVRVIAEGEWFSVYQAAPANGDPDWPADYVLKCPRGDCADVRQAVRLLRREAEVSRDVTHPNLATILDEQLEHAPPYLVAPCYEGKSVREHLAESRLPVSIALWMARQVCAALVALHDRGWRHGDVQPANVIVSPLGHATLIDLGFAQRTAPSQTIRQDWLLTTLAYAPPELLATTGEACAASDIYSLGAMLYEMLTGLPPFRPADTRELMLQHLQKTPEDARVFEPRLPSRVARLVMQTLLKNPSRRPTAAELVKQLRACEIEFFEMRE